MIDRRQAMGLAVGIAMLAGCSGGGSGGGSTAGPTLGTGSSAAASQVPASAASGGGTGAAVAAGGDLCGLLGPGDFAAVGVPGTGAPKENNPDVNNAYCVYAGQSAGTGGVEFDAFLAGTTADSKAAYDAASAPMLDFANDGKTAFPDADGASLRTDIPGGYAGITIWKGKLVFDIGIPTTDAAKDELVSLAKLVLQRAAGLT